MVETGKKNFYPPFIVLLVGIFLSFLAWSSFQAIGLGSKVTDADYYGKGLKYTATQAEKRAAVVLGWGLTSRLRGHILELYLTDHEGNEVFGATGSLYLAIPDTAENVHLPLQETGAGHYRVRLNDKINGAIQARLEMEKNGIRLHRQLLLNLPT